jgi:hypothetical protein
MARNSYGGFWTKTKIIWFSILGLVLIVGLSVGIPIANDAINATTAPITSKLQEKSQVFTAQNRISQYNKFYDELGTYNTDLAAVANNKTTLRLFESQNTPAEIRSDLTGTLEQESAQDQQAVNGAETTCVSAAQAYNQDSRKVQTGAHFKGVDLSKAVSVTACNTAGGAQK